MSISNRQAPLPQAQIKTIPEHFRVHEVLELPFSGQGEHAYFFIEKTALNTTDVVAMLAKHFQVAPQAIGYAGRKDKHAVTQQWFSVPTPVDQWQPEDARLKVLLSRRRERKLRLGDHSANTFELTLTQIRHWCGSSLDTLSDCFPNYFGAQRLSASNIAQAQDWLQAGGWGQESRDQPRGARRRQQKHNSPRRGWHLSVLRSLLFNAVLDKRVAADNYSILLDGDLAENGMPTGPLWGRGRSGVSGVAAEIETSALTSFAQTCEALEYAGVSMDRRVLAVQPQDLNVCQATDNEWVVKFTLPPGVYATTLLAKHFNVIDASAYHE